MGKATESQKEAKAVRDSILTDILNVPQPKVSILTSTTGVRFDLTRSFLEFQAAMDDADKYIIVKTFSWDGKRGSIPMVFTTAMLKESIAEYSEVGTDQWTRYVTDATERAMQQRMQATPGISAKLS